MPGEIHQGEQGQAAVAQLLRTAQFGQVDDGSAFHHFAGQRHSDAEIADEFRAFADFIREDLEPLGAPHAERFCARAEALDFMTLDEYLTLYGASGLLRSVLGNAFLGEFGSDLDEVSALAFLRFRVALASHGSTPPWGLLLTAFAAGQVSNSIVVDRLGLGPAGRQAVTPTRATISPSSTASR